MYVSFKGTLVNKMHLSFTGVQLWPCKWFSVKLRKKIKWLLGLFISIYLIYCCLYDQNRRIRGLFEKCTIDHEARMETLQNRIREKLQSDARWRQLQEDSNKSVCLFYLNPSPISFYLNSLPTLLGSWYFICWDWHVFLACECWSSEVCT